MCVLLYGLLENWTASDNKQAILELCLTRLPVQIALAYFLTYVLLPKYLTKGAYVQFIIILLLSAYVVSVSYSLYRAFYFEPKYPGYFKTQTVHTPAMYFAFLKFLMYITTFYTLTGHHGVDQAGKNTTCGRKDSASLSKSKCCLRK